MEQPRHAEFISKDADFYAVSQVSGAGAGLASYFCNSDAISGSISFASDKDRNLLNDLPQNICSLMADISFRGVSQVQTIISAMTNQQLKLIEEDRTGYEMCRRGTIDDRTRTIGLAGIRRARKAMQRASYDHAQSA